MVNKRQDPEDQAFRTTMGADLRRLREKAGVSGRMVAEDALSHLFGNRDWLSKVERGANSIDFIKYLELVWYYREVEPDHPGVALARRYLPAKLRQEIGFAAG
jgi:hypothetical protein